MRNELNKITAWIKKSRARLVAPLAGMALFAVFVILYHIDHALYLWVLSAFFVPQDKPFLDMGGVLSAIQCARQGLDVFVTNPCDILKRVHDYSPLWLVLKTFPIMLDWLTPVGLVTDMAFLAVLVLLPAPQMPSEQRLRILATLSPAVIYALERANVDILMFLLLILGGQLLITGGRAKLLGYPLLLLAGLLKYYPLVTLLVLVREKLRTCLALGIGSGIALVVFIAVWHHDILRSFALVPRTSYFLDMFGAVNLSRGFVSLLFGGRLARGGVGMVGLIAFSTTSLVLGMQLARKDAFQARFAAIGEAEKIHLLIGALSITGCFFAGQSLYYRGILLLLIIPGLAALERNPGPGISRGIMLTVVFLMWSEMFRIILASFELSASAFSGFYSVFWIVRELLWWRLVVMFLGIIICYMISSPAWQDLVSILRIGKLSRNRLS